jgi:glycosyltransferase involved in cell wall biosynthesis
MKLSVGIPVHNAIECALRAIDCVLNACKANCWDYELHVIDDNSSPENNTRLRERLCLVDQHGFVTTQSLTSTPAPNLAFNVNWLLDNVAEDADYYLNLETDVFVSAETLELLRLRLEENPDVCMTFPKQLTLNGERADFHFCQRGYPLVGAMDDDLLTDRYFKWTHMGCTMVRGDHARNREIRVDERFKLFCADQDYSLRLRQVTSGHISYVASAQVLHAGHASSREGLTSNADPECFARVDSKWCEMLKEPA